MNIINKIIRAYLLIGVFIFAGCGLTPDETSNVKLANRSIKIEPDYTQIVIPPNIAPLNFKIMETGEDYFVKIHSENGDAIKIKSSTGSIQIPISKWRQLLDKNIGKEIYLDIYVKDNKGEWSQFNRIVNKIANERIDSYLTYRKFKPLFNTYTNMGIFQRCLEDFNENTVIHNRLTEENCINCHNFYQNKAERWLLHMRGGKTTSMILVVDGEVKKIDTKTLFNGPTAYPAWHPSGDLIAFSVSSLVLFFRSAGECRDVLDKNSNIVLYDINQNVITANEQIADPEQMEIWPAWTPDGKYLYFCSSPKLDSYRNPKKPEEIEYDSIKYSLMRVKFDPLSRTWGKRETVISSLQSGLSITEPRISPDGKFLLFTGADYSQFPIYLKSADVYLLNMETGKWKKLDVNSDDVDSFHSWSSNSRWFVFSSKRQDGLFTKPYFCWIDSAGNTSKPFVMPQEDPSFYSTFLEVYNVPELSNEAIKINPRLLAKVALSDEILKANLDPAVLTSSIFKK